MDYMGAICSMHEREIFLQYLIGKYEANWTVLSLMKMYQFLKTYQGHTQRRFFPWARFWSLNTHLPYANMLVLTPTSEKVPMTFGTGVNNIMVRIPITVFCNLFSLQKLVWRLGTDQGQ
jgi:hypothetical protein